MKTRFIPAVVAAALLSLSAVANEQASAAENAKTAVLPTAILSFEERGSNVKEYGRQVSDLLFASLASNPAIHLVDRAELDKTLGEQSLSVSGAVKSDEAVKVGQLTGAKLLVTGSVMQVDRKIFLVAKVLGTETSQVVGLSVNGKASDELSPLVEKLAEQIGKAIAEKGSKLVAKQVTRTDRIASLKKSLGDAPRVSVRIEIPERHVGLATVDPAAETELTQMLTELGFKVLDAKQSGEGAADILISGEGFSETAGRVGSMVSVKARLEVKAVDRKSGKVLASDRQTAIVVDATEQVAGKGALQEAAAIIAERLVPKLAPPSKS